ncbi:hypothetical protein H3C70_04055 [Patescibacteria group bacterium]|nr:hypothetical protein [Patescibacteria group bacterium]
MSFFSKNRPFSPAIVVFVVGVLVACGWIWVLNEANVPLRIEAAVAPVSVIPTPHP